MISITKEFTFEMAHQLDGYCGKCANIHGHSYRLAVTIAGVPDADPQSPCCGMIMDFAQLKRIVHEHVIDVFDHALVLRSGSPVHALLSGSGMCVIALDTQPTCENLLLHMAHRLQCALPSHVRLLRAVLHETASSSAQWEDAQ
jgi:6-pyruvoyltetrahydropterin/6-carboxytetrahydropterin synthase